jgi:hypothetical protein
MAVLRDRALPRLPARESRNTMVGDERARHELYQRLEQTLERR